MFESIVGFLVPVIMGLVALIVIWVLWFFSTDQRLRRYVRNNCNIPESWWEKTNKHPFESIRITFRENDGQVQALSLDDFISLFRVRKRIGNPIADEWIVEITYSDAFIMDAIEYSLSHLLHSLKGWQIPEYQTRYATLKDKVGERLLVSFNNVPMPGTGIDGEILRIAHDYRNVDHYKFETITKAFADALEKTKSTHRSDTLKAFRKQVEHPDKLFENSHRPVIKLPEIKKKEKPTKDGENRDVIEKSR